MQELVIDNFAGGGGASTGIEAALGRPIDYAINHSPEAIEIHRLNHPNTVHLCEDAFDVSPRKLCAGRPVGLAWFSPDCKHFSKAKGGTPRSKHIRGLAWVVVRWAKEVRPRIIILENVEEFKTWGPLDDDGRPDKSRAGETFRKWLGQLRGIGYAVESRELVAADYGAPTTRKRLFIVARCDGQPINWPGASHSKIPRVGQSPWRSAAECIDWTIPVRSIFDRSKPLAEATQRRIAEGIRRFVVETANPFILRCAHGEASRDGKPRWGHAVHNLIDPLPTQTASKDFALAVPFLATCNHGGDGFRGQGFDKPLCTVTGSRDAHGLAIPFLSQYFGGRVGKSLSDPVPTITAWDHNALASVSLISNNTNNAPHSVEDPLGTITTGNRHFLAASFLSKFYGTNIGSDLRHPVPTITGGGNHIAEVRAFLTLYYNESGIAQSLHDPARTITAKARLGLVTVAGVDYQICDIGLRMLEPHELLIAQGFPRDYILTGSKANRVAMIGNSVCPPLAEAIVRANCSDLAAEEVA